MNPALEGAVISSWKAAILLHKLQKKIVVYSPVRDPAAERPETNVLFVSNDHC